jgi:hypothetical protein
VLRVLPGDVPDLQSLRPEVHRRVGVPLREEHIRPAVGTCPRVGAETLDCLSASLPRLRCQHGPAAHEAGKTDMVSHQIFQVFLLVIAYLQVGRLVT